MKKKKQNTDSAMHLFPKDFQEGFSTYDLQLTRLTAIGTKYYITKEG